MAIWWGAPLWTAPGREAGRISRTIHTHDGQRVVKSVGGQSTVYHYDLAGQLIAETDGDGNLIKVYVWLHGQPLAQVGASGAVYYYHNDHLGTPQRMTDGSGAVVWAADYLPFGQADVNVGTVVNNLRFAGQYYDAETGLHYNYHRYYDPQLGRYLRADPIGLKGGINPYLYVQNNPVNWIDPLGLCRLYFMQRAALRPGLSDRCAGPRAFSGKRCGNGSGRDQRARYLSFSPRRE